MAPELVNNTLVFAVKGTQIYILKSLLVATPSLFPAAFGTSDPKPLQDLVRTVERLSTRVRIFNIVFHALNLGWLNTDFFIVETDQVKYGVAPDKSVEIPEDDLEKVTLCFDQLVDSIVLADAIEAERIVEILYQEFKEEYSTVLLTIAQFRKLFFSGNERLRQFLLLWTFGFQYLDRPYAVSGAFSALLKEAVLNVPGFADYVRPKLDLAHGGPGFTLPSGAATVRITISVHLDTKDEEEEAETTTKGKRKRKPDHQKKTVRCTQAKEDWCDRRW
jgi:hypothetical protein